MYQYIYRISKLLVILLVTLVSGAIIGVLMEARGAQALEVFAMGASSESLAAESGLSQQGTSQLDNSLRNVPLAASDGVFNPFTVYASGSWAEAVVSGEWNGDGKNDVMLVTGLAFDVANDNKGQLFEQTAPDMLTRTGNLEAGESPTALARGDFNHDGLDDVAILNQGDNTLGIFLQSGGTLGGMSTYNTQDSPDSLAVGDFNGDLRDDIAVSHANSQSIALYQQQEDGAFGESISVDVRSGGFNVLASGDLNGDGLDDLVLLRGAGPSEEQLAIFYQEVGGLSDPVLRTVDDDTYLSYGLAVGDITSDGRDDIVVSAGGNSAHASLNVFVQESDGTLATEATIYDTTHLPKAVAIGDVNHDGRNDLLVVHAAWQTLSLYSQSETGTLNAAVAVDLPYTDDYRPHALALADVTDDGGLDVLLANHSALSEENGLVVLSNTSNAPTSRITSPYPSLHVTQSTPILIEGTASANATTLEVSTDGGQTWHSQPASPNWSYNWSTPSDGYHIILSRAIDAAGNVQSPAAQTRILVGEVSGELSACVTLQGRPTKPHSRWSVPLRVSLTIAGESAPTYTLTPTSDDNGCFTLPNIAPATYEIRVKHAHTLQNVQTVTLAAGNNTVDLGTLREGDANDDNFVTIIDFSTLAAAFGVCEGTDGYDARADFNEDGCVTILDFSLLASNFGQSGQSAPLLRVGEQALKIALALEPAQSAVSTGDTFTVMAAIEAGEQAVDGAQVVLNFDSELLEVVTVSGGERLPQGLQNEVDNESGTLRFAAGTLEGFPNGTIELLEVEFRALAPSDGSSLSFGEGTDVTFGGVSVLGEQAGSTIVISSPTSVTMSRLSGGAPSLLWALLPLALTILAGAFISRRRD